MNTTQTGGAGGNIIGAGTGFAGSGGNSNVVNAVQGDTTGILNLNQTAVGGAGGTRTATATAAKAATRVPELTNFGNNDPSLLDVTVTAIGGQGGTNGTFGVGGGTAQVNATAGNTNANTVIVTGNATGGAGGDGTNAVPSGAAIDTTTLPSVIFGSSRRAARSR